MKWLDVVAIVNKLLLSLKLFLYENKIGLTGYADTYKED